jgi:NAD(P)-dependent dehydrogenase (short-subunit alcohol dehydrogenase family)
VATSRESTHVVNVSFALACIPRATEPAYVATKAGLIALSQSGRADWGGFGVGVSVVCPRVTNTAIAEHAVEGEETMGDTTWGGWHVTGTFDGQRFRLTEPPGPSQPGDDVDGGSDFRPPVTSRMSSTRPRVAPSGTQIDAVFDRRDLVAAWVSVPAGDWDGPFVGNVVVRGR